MRGSMETKLPGTQANQAGKLEMPKKGKEEANLQSFTDDDGEGASQSQVQQGVADTVWKVGCYKINPSTPSGQKFFILHMLVLPLIPITALVIQNSVTMNTLLGYQFRVKTIRNQVTNDHAAI